MYLSQQNIREFRLEDSHQRTPKICASDRRLIVWGSTKDSEERWAETLGSKC